MTYDGNKCGIPSANLRGCADPRIEFRWYDGVEGDDDIQVRYLTNRLSPSVAVEDHGCSCHEASVVATPDTAGETTWAGL